MLLLWLFLTVSLYLSELSMVEVGHKCCQLMMHFTRIFEEECILSSQFLWDGVSVMFQCMRSRCSKVPKCMVDMSSLPTNINRPSNLFK